MTTSIEQRITQMRFDNSQFEKAVQTTIGTLDKLKQKLDFKGASAAFSDITKSARTVDLGSMSSSVDGLKLKFDVLGIAATAAIARIATQAQAAGQRMMQSLSTDQIASGFSEYETKIGSIQTILANTAKYGTSLADVSASLQALNEYSDKTIYNFGDMTKNIGLFTNAGLRVEDATKMIQGFSNVAAASGTTSEGAARAAYQLSQALSIGKVTIMDWRSLTTVGMGNKNMQDGIIQIAQSMGTLKKANLSAAEVQKDFNGSLQEGWLTADVMSQYLQIMTYDAENMTDAQKAAYDAQLKSVGLNDQQIAAFKTQAQTASDAATKVRTFTQLISTLREAVGSGWAKTFELLIGDFDTATERFTAINDVLGPMLTSSGDARNALLQSWVDSGGHSAALAVIGNAFTSVIKIIGAVKSAFANIFPPASTDTMAKVAQGIQKFADSLVVSDGVLNAISGGFKVFFGAIKFLIGLLRTLVTVVTAPFRIMRDAILAAFGDLPGFAAGAESAINGFLSAFNVQFIGFDKLGDKIVEFFSLFDGFDPGAFTELSPIFQTITAQAEAMASKAGEAIRQTFSFENMQVLGQKAIEVWNSFVGVLNSVGALVGRTKGTIVDWFGGFVEGIVEGLKKAGAAIKNATEMFRKYIIDMNNGTSNAINGIGGDTVVTTLLSGLNLGLVIMIAKKLKGIVDAFKEVSDIPGNLNKAFEGLTGALKTLQTSVKVNMILKIAAALLILAIALTVLSQIDPERLQSAAVGIGVSIAALTVGLLAVDKMALDDTGLIKVAIAMILVAVAISILAGALQKIGALDLGQIAKGIGAIAIMMGLLMDTMKVVSSMQGSMIKAAIGLTIFAGAIYLLGGAIALLGLTPIDVLVQGGIALALIMGALILFMKAIPAQSVMAAGAGMMMLATAIGMLTTSVMALGLIPWETLVQGGISLAILLGMLAGSMIVMQNATKGAAVLVAVALALGMLVPVVLALGMVPLDILAQGLGALAIALIMLTASMVIMSGATAGAAALLAVAAGMFVLALAVIMLGSAGLEVIAVGLLALAGVMVIFALGALAMAAAIPAMVGMGGAILMFGAAALMVAGAMVLFSIGLMMLGPAAAVGAAGITLLGLAAASLGDKAVSILAVGAAFIVLGVGVLVVAAAILVLGVGLTMVGIGLALVGASAAIGVIGLVALVSALRGMLLDIPLILALGGALALLGAGMTLSGVGAALLGVGAAVLALGLAALIGVLQVVPDLIGPFTESINRLSANAPALDAFGGAANNMATSIGAMSSSLMASGSAMQAAGNSFILVSSSISTAMASISAMPAVVQASMSGITSSMSSGAIEIQATVLAIGVSFALMKTNLDKSATDTESAMKFIASAVTSGSSSISSAIRAMGSDIVSTLSSVQSSTESEAVKIGVAINNGIVRGLSDSSRVKAAARSVASAALSAANAELGINSPSKEFTKTGMFSGQGIALGLVNSVPAVTKAVTTVASGMLLTMKSGLSDMAFSIDEMIDSGPVIRPVIDLDSASKDAKTLNGMLTSAFNVETPKMSAMSVAASVNSGNVSAASTPISSSGTNVSFTQINNSPKALSRLEIYRQTNNQISKLQGVLGK